MTVSASTLLRVQDVEAIYDQAILALRGVSLTVTEGAIVALLGANGAGKTTTLKAVSNLLRAERGTISRGSITFKGEAIIKQDPADLVRRGIAQVLEGRHCFAHLTVEENLLSGGFVRRVSRRVLNQDLEQIYTWFPRLKARRTSLAGLTSGGEQQMVAIGRALMTKPQLVLLDEPSMGLAPMIVQEIFDIVRGLNRDQGVSFLLAEQNAALTLKYADYGYVLENGRVVAEGEALDLSQREDVKDIYLGAGKTPPPETARIPSPAS
ncbi:MAG: ABC transporter ATP-binding protein [Dongiaceae bacterium]